MVTRDKLLEFDKVINFIESIQRQLLTEEEASDITDEMMDHMLSMVSDFVEQGDAVEKAVEKMLKNMGDPFSIGYAFTDFKAMQKREWLRKGFKYMGLGILVALFGYWIYLDIVFGGGELEELLFFPIGIPIVYYSTKYIHLNRTGGMTSGFRRQRYLEIESKPIMVLWPAKKGIPFEYIAVPLFFTPILIILIGGIMSDMIAAQKLSAFIIQTVLFIFAIWSTFYSEKYRMPKMVVLEDGLLIKGKLLTWTSISSLQIKTDYAYKEKPTKVSYQLIDGLYAGKFFVNDKQKSWLTKYLKEKVR